MHVMSTTYLQSTAQPHEHFHATLLNDLNEADFFPSNLFQHISDIAVRACEWFHDFIPESSSALSALARQIVPSLSSAVAKSQLLFTNDLSRLLEVRLTKFSS
jgi:hypothetical protein